MRILNLIFTALLLLSAVVITINVFTNNDQNYTKTDARRFSAIAHKREVKARDLEAMPRRAETNGNIYKAVSIEDKGP